MASPHVNRWQNKTIAATSDFRGPLMMALPVAAFWFLGQWLSLPGYAEAVARLPDLLRFALDKARYMPDFALILAGFAAFHFQRDVRGDWDWSVARRLYLRLLLPVTLYFVLAVILFEVASSLGSGHRLSPPWSAPLLAPVFWTMATATILLILLPPLLYWSWTAVPDVCWSAVAICIALYGLSFHSGFHHHLWLWPFNAVIDFACGIFLCATLFRAVDMFTAVRGPAIILGWVALLAGSILEGPALFFVGFVMIVSGMAVGERSWYLPIERWLLSWSRTALPFALVQPAVLMAWSTWGLARLPSPWLAGLAALVVTQLLAVILYAIVIPPARRLFAARPAEAPQAEAPPAKMPGIKVSGR